MNDSARVLEFDAETHTYHVAGRLIPSVTQVLAPLWELAGVPRAVLEFARERGEAVHRATALDDKGILDPASLDERIKPYLMAWRSFRLDAGFICLAIEEPEHSEKLGFAGTPDRRGRLLALRDAPRAVVEIKTTVEINPVFGLQTAGYRLIKNDDSQRFVVQLKPDGTYRLHHMSDPADEAVFYGALSLYHWKYRHGLDC